MIHVTSFNACVLVFEWCNTLCFSSTDSCSVTTSKKVKRPVEQLTQPNYREKIKGNTCTVNACCWYIYLCQQCCQTTQVHIEYLAIRIIKVNGTFGIFFSTLTLVQYTCHHDSWLLQTNHLNLPSCALPLFVGMCTNVWCRVYIFSGVDIYYMYQQVKVIYS